MREEKWWHSIRSIITLMIVFAWCLAFTSGRVSTEAFGMTVGSVITFYFMKKRTEENGTK